MNEDIVVPLAGIFMIIVISVGIPLVVMLGRKWERDSKQQRLSPDLAVRLERIEQAVDAIAIEVERISEGQRFTTRLLTDRTGAEPLGLPASQPARRPE